jgi:hypothetical protein
LVRLHAQAGEGQAKPVGAAELGAFTHLPLKDQYLMTEGEDLPIAVVGQEASGKGIQGRE